KGASIILIFSCISSLDKSIPSSKIFSPVSSSSSLSTYSLTTRVLLTEGGGGGAGGAAFAVVVVVVDVGSGETGSSVRTRFRLGDDSVDKGETVRLWLTGFRCCP